MIEFDNVYKTYPLGDGVAVQALSALSLTVHAGEQVSIVGTNGSGKTSLLKCAAGLLAPDAGTVRLQGRNPFLMKPSDRGRLVGMMHQNAADGVAAHLTVLENLALGALRGRRPGLRGLFHGRLKGQLRRFVEEVSQELPERLQQRCGTLSGGQRQSVALLTAVFGRPKVLLLDEHTVSLDPDAAQLVWQLTRRLAQEHGLTVLAVSHNLRDALAFGSRLLVMHAGKIVLDVCDTEKHRLTPENLLAMLRSATPASVASEASLSVGAVLEKNGE